MINYPRIILNREKLRKNIRCIKNVCSSNKINMAGVIKGCNAKSEVIKLFLEEDIKILASSRISHIKKIKKIKQDMGNRNTETMLIRIPMKSEAEEVILNCNISLNSEVEVLRELDCQGKKHKKKHKVIMMFDIGDLREGFFNVEEGIDIAVEVENNLHNLELLGIGTNLGCYGAIKVTPEKMDELVRIGEQIERKIGRPLEVISGGGTTAIPLILSDKMAEKVNFLRVGEAILLAQDLKDEWGHILKECSQDTFNLQMEIIEIKDKATYPIGEIACDGFGQKNQYEDKGIRKRALLAGGKVDYGFPDMLIPKLKGVSIVGASSDHTIVDIEDVEVDLKIGDILDFQLTYATLVYGTSSADVGFKVV